ncbi:Protein LIN52 [Arabidopsis suecica]|uniref:Protein LIN52 n=1 Tax=Arabidopsis suecica TaxID=45249 RepID=A0A8T1YEA2_ARASU|nr:Protein LIN52 [Arabidopsis suecica]
MEPHGGGGTRSPPKNPIQQDSKSIGVKVESPATNAASGRLVYVRRRVEVDTSKAAASTNPNPPKVPPQAQAQAQEPTTTTSHKLDWEERYLHLQMLLNKLNQSDRTDHVQMLWSLSSAELSKHAVDLEKRSIQFSLEEAREMQRVAALNVLGRSVNSLKSTSNDGE